jgi:competence protein ComEC
MMQSSASSPVRFEPEKSLPMPPLFAAIGMAFSYYAYPLFISVGTYFFFGLLFFLVAVISFLRVLRYMPERAVEAPKGPPLFPLSYKAISNAGILAVAAAVGFSLGIAARQTVPDHAVMGFPAERVRAVSGVLLEDPRSLQGGSGLGVLRLSLSVAEGGFRASARGNVTVFFPADSIPRLREFGRGSEIYADGVYYVGRRGPVFNASSVHIVKPAPALEQLRTSLRMILLDRFQSQAPPVWGSLASALLLGVRDDLDVDLSEGFRNSGVAYILALSGMHLAIISSVLAFLLRRPLGIRWASLVGAIFIICYVFVAGSQPSLVRAAIMYLIGTFALWGFLKKNTLSVLSMAFIIQLLFQSETGISLSFILSYLAMAGILILGQPLRNLFRGRLPELLSGSLSVSLGAFIATSPVVAFFFGSLRPVGILVGLIVVPLTSLFMVFAMAALAASFLPFPLWNVLDFILTWIYRFLEYTVILAGRVPGFSISNPAPVLVFTILLSLFILYIQKKDQAYRNSIASFN